MEKYKNKYRIPSARASWWDYGWNGAYFITICTGNRMHYFGRVSKGKMELSPCGVVADLCWHLLPHHFSFLELGAFVVMPNHVHGILIISKPDGVETRHALSLHHPPPTRYQNQGKNTISAMVGSYKSAVTRHANRLGFDFQWQSRFYDNIIRTDADYQRINDYIENNPMKWDSDKF